MEAIVWSQRQDELAWLAVHNAALQKLGGVPAGIRVDHTKTAIAQGAGPWGVVNERDATYARVLRFHVDATRPRAPQEKGKVERRILAHKTGLRSAPSRVMASSSSGSTGRQRDKWRRAGAGGQARLAAVLRSHPSTVAGVE